MGKKKHIGPYKINTVHEGNCLDLVAALPDGSVDVVVTSPPYWGQRLSNGVGIEDDPRVYLGSLTSIFNAILPKLKADGILWINIGDAYDTPVNWRAEDREYSTLGADQTGLNANNSAYTKPRAKRKAFIDKNQNWLKYGNLLALTYRMVIELSNSYFFRGEVIWKKLNPMPEGRCRRPHRHHESIYLFSKSAGHQFQTTPPVGSVWEFGNERIAGEFHYSRFPLELPRRCINAYGKLGSDIMVLDPFSGSGTTGMAALSLGCSYIGFEIDGKHVAESNNRLMATFNFALHSELSSAGSKPKTARTNKPVVE